MKKKNVFLVLTVTIALALALTLVQGFMHFIPMRKLGGHTSEAKPVELTFSNYYEGAYQDYLNEKATGRGAPSRRAQFWTRATALV